MARRRLWQGCIRVRSWCSGSTRHDSPASSTSAKKEAQVNEKLRTGIARLAADTKAGKVKLSPSSQFKPARGNNLSKGQKIAIGVGIAAVVVVAIVALHVRRHLFDDFRPFAP